MERQEQKGERENVTSKEKKQILQQYGEIDTHIKELQEELRAWRARATAVSPVLSDLPRGGSPDGTKTERAVEHLAKIERQIDVETDELCRLRYKIVSAIKALPDLRERRVLYLAYIGKSGENGVRRLKLWQIADEMGYSFDRIKHIHGNALLHIRLD